MAEKDQKNLRRGDIIEISMHGSGKLGEPVSEIMRAEVLGFDKDYLYILYRNTDNPDGGATLEKISIPLDAVDFSKYLR